MLITILLIFQTENGSFFVHAYDKFRRLKGGFVQERSRVRFTGEKPSKVGREYNEEKREVDTGPNPLHNR